MSRPVLTVALANFDRHAPLFLGETAEHPAFALDYLDVGMTAPGRHGLRRHARMLKEAEFDVAEVSLASYIMARQRGAAFTAAPVFPRRLFSQPCIHVPTGSRVRSPAELAGKRVAIRAFQVTLSVQAKGDLASLYGLDWRDVHWFTREEETVPWAASSGLRIAPLPQGRTLADLLSAGELDAVIDPFPPPELAATGQVRPLFADPVAESEAYFKARGYFPAMHLLAIRNTTIAAHPELAAYLIQAWDEAKAIAMRGYNDPAYTLLPCAAPVILDQRRRFGADPWPSGVAANRANLEDFLGYMREQHLIGSAEGVVDDLFDASVLDT